MSQPSREYVDRTIIYTAAFICIIAVVAASKVTPLEAYKRILDLEVRVQKLEAAR